MRQAQINNLKKCLKFLEDEHVTYCSVYTLHKGVCRHVEMNWPLHTDRRNVFIGLLPLKH